MTYTCLSWCGYFPRLWSRELKSIYTCHASSTMLGALEFMKVKRIFIHQVNDDSYDNCTYKKLYWCEEDIIGYIFLIMKGFLKGEQVLQFNLTSFVECREVPAMKQKINVWNYKITDITFQVSWWNLTTFSTTWLCFLFKYFVVKSPIM